MFTQKISMDCTKEQYEKYLKEELLKMGYKESCMTFWRHCDGIANNLNGDNGKISNITECGYKTHNRTYLGSFNSPLFLALAAMTDNAEGNYGEYFIGKYSGDFYIMNDAFRRYIHLFNVRKATKEELMEKFGEVETDINYDISKALKEAGDRFCREIKLGGEQIEKVDDAIRLLKSLGFKVMRKTETWEEV